MPKRARQDDIDPHKKDRTSRPAPIGTPLLDRQGRVVVEPGGKLPASIQPVHETLSQKHERLKGLSREQRTTFVEGNECTIAVLDTNRFITGRVCGVGPRLVRVQPLGGEHILVFDKNTRREEGRVPMEVFTQYEWERTKLWREQVRPKLENLVHDYKQAGNMDLEELQALDAVLKLALEQREGKR